MYVELTKMQGGKSETSVIPILPCTSLVLPSYSLRTPLYSPRTPFVLPHTPSYFPILSRTSFVLPRIPSVLQKNFEVRESRLFPLAEIRYCVL